MEYHKTDFKYDLVRYIFPTDDKLKACPAEEINYIVDIMTRTVYQLGTTKSLQELMDSSPGTRTLLQCLKKAVQNDNYGFYEIAQKWAKKIVSEEVN